MMNNNHPKILMVALSKAQRPKRWDVTRTP